MALGQTLDHVIGRISMTHNETALTLTQKEETFWLAVIAGQNPSEAYRKAYKPQRDEAEMAAPHGNTQGSHKVG